MEKNISTEILLTFKLICSKTDKNHKERQKTL